MSHRDPTTSERQSHDELDALVLVAELVFETKIRGRSLVVVAGRKALARDLPIGTHVTIRSAGRDDVSATVAYGLGTGAAPDRDSLVLQGVNTSAIPVGSLICVQARGTPPS